jgi:hypothetical protein
MKLRDDVDALGFQRDSEAMLERLMDKPEFAFEGAKVYTAEDGEFIVVANYGSREGLDTWRDDPDHRVVIERGRSEYVETAWLADVNPRIIFDRQTGSQYPLVDR